MNDVITNKEMADYLNRAMNLRAVKKIVGDSIGHYSTLADWFAKYYISTGDNSERGIVKLLMLFKEVNFENKYSLNSDNAYMKLLIDTVLEKINKSDNPTVLDKIKALQIIETRNNNNRFFTHCFPGAIIEMVKDNGLDASKELFKDELRILEQNDKTSYKTGTVCYCELSKSGLEYARSGVPERINYAIGGLKDRLEGETKKEQYLRSLTENLEANSKLSPDAKKTIFEAGKKIIDFYCSDNRIGIAVFRNKNASISPMKQIKFSNLLVSRDKEVSDFLSTTNIGKKIKNVLLEIDNNEEQGLAHYNQIMEETKKLYPNYYEEISGKVDELFYSYMKFIAVKNFRRSFCDGYEVQRIAKEEFEIVTTKSPIDMFIEEEDAVDKMTHNMAKKEKKNTTEQIQVKEMVIKRLIQLNKDFLRVDRIEDINLTICINEDNIDFLDRYSIKSRDGGFYVADCSKDMLESKCKKRIYNNLLEKFDDEKISKIIEGYKKTEYYKEDSDWFDSSPYELKRSALLWFAKETYNDLSQDVKDRMISQTINEVGFVHVKIENNSYVVKRGDEIKRYPIDTMIDKLGDAPFNALYNSSISEQKDNGKYSK